MASMTRQQIQDIITQSGESPETVLTRLKERGVTVTDSTEQPERKTGFIDKVKSFFGGDAQAQEQPLPPVQPTSPAPVPTEGMNEAQMNTFRRLYENETDPVRKQKLQKLLESNGVVEDVSNVVVPINSITITETTPSKGWLERMQDKFMVRAANVDEILMATGTEQQSGVEGIFQVLGQGAGLFVDSVFEAGRSGFRALPGVVERPLRSAGRSIAGAIASAPGVPQLAESISSEVQKFQQQNPRAYRNVAATFNLVDAAGTATAIYKVGGAGMRGLNSLKTKVKNTADDISKFAWSTKDDVLEAKAKAAGYIKTKLDRPIDEVTTRWTYNSQAKKEIKELVDNSVPEVRKAVDLGVDFGDAQRLTHSTKNELDEIAEMVTRANKKVLGQTGKEVDDVVGQAFMKKVKYLENQRKAIGSQLDDLARSLPNVKDGTAPYTILERMKQVPGLDGISASQAKGKWVLDFSGTGLADDLAAQAKITSQFNKAVNKTYKGMHTYRTFLNNELKKTSATRVKDVNLLDEMATDSIRGGMLDTINGANEAYREVAKSYAIVENTLKPVRRQFQSVGLIRDLSDDVLNIRSAQLMRRLTSNNRAAIQALTDQVDLIATKFGLNDGINVTQLQEASNIIEKYYQTTRATTFAGQAAQGINMGVPNLRNLATKALEKTPLIQNLLPSPEASRKALEELVFSLIKK